MPFWTSWLLIHDTCAAPFGEVILDMASQCAVCDRQMSLQGCTEASTCKYGLFLLRAALSPAAKKAPPWSSFLALYELLEEYALHLIQVRPHLSTDLPSHVWAAYSWPRLLFPVLCSNA